MGIKGIPGEREGGGEDPTRRQAPKDFTEHRLAFVDVASIGQESAGWD